MSEHQPVNAEKDARRYLRPWWISRDGMVRVLRSTSPLGGALVTCGSEVVRVYAGPFARTRAVWFAQRLDTGETRVMPPGQSTID